jgi:hypothetical protein
MIEKRNKEGKKMEESSVYACVVGLKPLMVGFIFSPVLRLVPQVSGGCGLSRLIL